MKKIFLVLLLSILLPNFIFSENLTNEIKEIDAELYKVQLENEHLKNRIEELESGNKNNEINSIENRVRNLENNNAEIIVSSENINWWFCVLSGIFVIIGIGVPYFLKKESNKEIAEIRRLKIDVKDIKKDALKLLDEIRVIKNTADKELTKTSIKLQEGLKITSDKIKKEIIKIQKNESEKIRNIAEFERETSRLWKIAQEREEPKKNIKIWNELIKNYEDSNFENHLKNKKLSSLHNNLAHEYLKLGDLIKGNSHLEIANKFNPNNLAVNYNLACLYSLTDKSNKDKNNKDKMLNILNKLLKEGDFKSERKRNEFFNDSDFDYYRTDKDFKAFVKKVKNIK